MCIPPNTCFLGPIQVTNTNGISIGSAVYVGLTIVIDQQTDRQTDRQIDRQITLLCSTAMWPKNT